MCLTAAVHLAHEGKARGFDWCRFSSELLFLFEGQIVARSVCGDVVGWVSGALRGAVRTNGCAHIAGSRRSLI